MRAIQITEYGGPEVLVEAELPVPRPAPGEVLVRVTRAGINFADTHQRHDEYVHQPSLPLVPGAEVAGVREDTGERVVALCGTGGYAEYAVAPEARTVPIPEGVEDGAALALLVQGLTAWHLYRTAGRVVEGESVVVGAAAGGVGSLAIQLGRIMGAGRVLALASREDKRALALELGAHAALDPAPEGLAERLLEANGGAPVDVVFEMAGGEVFEQARRALAPLGRLVVCGIASKEPNVVRTGSLLRRSHAVVGLWVFHLVDRPETFAAPLGELFALAARGDLRVVIGETYALADVRRAHADLAARRTTGKLLLDPAR